jgi:ribonuclease HI
VWRIGCGTLPTNLNIFSRMSIGDPRCPLCNSKLESVSLVFFQCQATKMFWFGTCWGIRAELFVVNMDVDVVKLVVDPPIPLSDPSVVQMNKNLASVQIAFTLEAIWRFRNQHVHHSKIDNPNVSIKALEFRIVEHMQKLWAENSLFTPKDLKWLPPPHGIVKLNVDAAIFHSSACIAVIARNESGLIIKAWAKPFNSIDPLVAEAAAILWAIQIAKMESWNAITVEGDSKVCVDFLLQDFTASRWSIAGLCDDAKALAAEFSFCGFCWIKRKANMVAHTLAKLDPQFTSTAIFFP